MKKLAAAQSTAPDVAYECVRCPAKHTAPRDSALAMLAICEACQAKRYAAGMKAQRTPQAKETA